MCAWLKIRHLESPSFKAFQTWTHYNPLRRIWVELSMLSFTRDPGNISFLFFPVLLCLHSRNKSFTLSHIQVNPKSESETLSFRFATNFPPGLLRSDSRFTQKIIPPPFFFPNLGLAQGTNSCACKDSCCRMGTLIYFEFNEDAF